MILGSLMLQRACGDGRMASRRLQRVRFQEPCVLFFFAGVDIHSRETPVAIEPRLMVMADPTEPRVELARTFDLVSWIK